MRIIKLTQGKETTIDNCDYEYLSQWRWCFSNAGYAKRGLSDGTEILMHREVLSTMGLDPVHTDHIDGNALNNCRHNLRAATVSENMCNRGPQRNNTSGYKGVTFDKSREKWFSQIKIKGKHINLGRFDTKEDAALAYDIAAQDLHGDFAYQNDIAPLNSDFYTETFGIPWVPKGTDAKCWVPESQPHCMKIGDGPDVQWQNTWDCPELRMGPTGVADAVSQCVTLSQECDCGCNTQKTPARDDSSPEPVEQPDTSRTVAAQVLKEQFTEAERTKEGSDGS